MTARSVPMTHLVRPSTPARPPWRTALHCPPTPPARLACDAWLVAAVLDSDANVLDIGRLSRVVPRPMRRALIARDGGCAGPGCGRPPRWCQVKFPLFDGHRHSGLVVTEGCSYDDLLAGVQGSDR
jgi:hypothetical protein